MKEIFWKNRKEWLFLLSIFSFYSSGFALDEVEEDIPTFDYELSIETAQSSGDLAWSLFKSKDIDGEKGFTVNFTNISMIEYIRFISKITKTNFIFNEQDLQFNMTLVSEEPISLKNLLAALVQTLRIHNLTLLEQDNNLIITSSHAVSQIPEVISSDTELKETRSPIVTRLFRIKNANLTTVANIIRPMLSVSAMVDTSLETKQLIITDVITNVEKVATLLVSLDAPHSPLEIESYRAKHLAPQTLIDLTKQIVVPFAEGTPLIFVPRTDTNTIFVVSTPSLIERAMEVMEDLDKSPKAGSDLQLTSEKVFIYKIQNKTPQDLLSALQHIAKELEHSGAPSYKLILSLENVKWIKDSNSLLFLTDADNQPKIQEILNNLDTFTGSKSFYIYRIQKAGLDQIESSLKELAKSIRKASSDKELSDAIDSFKYIKETNSLVFTGSDAALKKLGELLPDFDVAVAQFSPSSHYVLYTPQFLSGKELENAIEELKKSLHSSGLSDPGLLSAIGSMKWVPATNTLIFTGDPQSLDHIQAMVKLVDIPAGSPSKIFIYNPKLVSREQIEEALDEIANRLDQKNISDRNLAKAIDTMTWITESQSFLFKADPATIEKLQSFLQDIDNTTEAAVIGKTFFLYALKYASGAQLYDQLQEIAKSLPQDDREHKAVLDAIETIAFIKDTNSFLIKGTIKAVDEVKSLVAQFDVPQAKPIAAEKTEFFIYKPLHLPASELQAALQETANYLKDSGLLDPNLLESIQTMRYVASTNSIVFTGTQESLDKTKEILLLVDVQGGATSQVAGMTFLIYKPKHKTAQELLSLLKNVAVNIQKTDLTSKDLTTSINNAKYVPETHALIFTGTSATLQRIEALLKQLDVTGTVQTEGLLTPSGYVIYTPLNVTGPNLIAMLQDFEQNLVQSGIQEKTLFQAIDQLKYVDKPGYILISGDKDSIAKIEELLKKFDVPSAGGGITSLAKIQTSFLVYKLQYHQGTEIQTALKQVATELSTSNSSINKDLLTAINSLQWIKITNSLLATGNAEVLTQLKELISSIDIPLRQVFIEVLIIQTTIVNTQAFGLQWAGKAQYLNRFATGAGNFPAQNPLTLATPNQALSTPMSQINATRTPLASDIPVPTGGGGFDLGIIGDIILNKGRSFISLGSLVNALQQDADSVVLMNPKIIAQDNLQSTIFVGQNIPFAGSLVSTIGGAAQQTSTNIEYRDVGVNLTITPILGTDDSITLDISNDISSQIANTTSGTNGIQGLQTSHTTMNTRVHVPNNHFVALSGMIQDSKDHFKSGLPCLGGLPVIGAFFSENDRTDSKNNLIILMRPTIIESAEQYKELTDRQEQLYKDRAVRPILKEEIDEGIDWVKTPDNE